MEHCGFTGIILAGGASSRMGQNKALLTFHGKTLLEHQVEKLRCAGAGEILLSGKGYSPLPGVRMIPDNLVGRGPLAGIQACLAAASFPQCLIISVDVPLIPVKTLTQLVRFHTGGITVLRHGVFIEPLISVYDASLAAQLAPLIENGGAAVRRTEEFAPWRFFDFEGDERLLHNCNTPEEFAQLEQICTSEPLC